MFNIILSICTAIYWFNHCNVSKSTEFMKAFCRLLTNQSVSYFFALNDYATNGIPVSSCKLACTSFHISGFLFVRYGHKASWHISGSVDYWFHFLCTTCSVQHYHHLDWGSEDWSICGCISVSLYTCMLPLLCLPIWLYGNENMWFMVFTLHHHYCSFIKYKDLTHIWYTNLIIYKNKEAWLVPKSNVWICPWNM